MGVAGDRGSLHGVRQPGWPVGELAESVLGVGVILVESGLQIDLKASNLASFPQNIDFWCFSVCLE